MFEQDYLMRMIHESARMLMKLLFRIDTYKVEDIKFEEVQTEMDYRAYRKMIDDGKINEAENQMLENLQTDDLEQMKLALMFYDYLNRKSVDFLEENGFSREEVRDGLKDVAEKYGYGNMMNSLMEAEEDSAMD